MSIKAPKVLGTRVSQWGTVGSAGSSRNVKSLLVWAKPSNKVKLVKVGR